MKTRIIGSSSQCDLVVEGETVAPIHAHVQVTPDGYLAVLDAGSDHGTFLQRNNHWVRIMRAELGTRDGIRLGDCEVEIDRLVALFDRHLRVQLRDSQSWRAPPMAAENAAARDTRVVLERPKRNPVTGNIEEDQ